MNTITNSNEESALEKAIALARLDPPVHVLPCWRRGKTKGPSTPNGFYDGTADEATIRRLWRSNPGNHVGVWPGPSRLLIEDLDVDPDKGLSGYQSVDRADVAWESTIHYETPSGGEHHIWPAGDIYIGPAAPIRDYPGVDRRSGNSLCLWYGPVPTQEEWTQMHAQITPSWLTGAAQGRPSSSRPSRVIPAEAEDLAAWVDALTEGDAVAKYAVAAERYGDLLKALVAFVEHTRTFPTWPGSRATFEDLANSYLNSPIATTPEADRPKKIVSILRWALGATSEVEDMTWAYERFRDTGQDSEKPVPPVPAMVGTPENFSSQRVTEEAGTASTLTDGGVH